MTAIKRASKPAILLFVAVNLIPFDGCSSKPIKDSGADTPRQIVGQVFVVTRSAQNIKLGSVTVSATSEKDVLALLENKESAIELIKPKLQKDVEDAVREYAAAERTHLRTRAAWDAVWDRKRANTSIYVSGEPEAFVVYSAAYEEKKRKERAKTEAHQRLLSFPTAEFLYQLVPEGPSKAVTDAEGNFVLVVPRQGRYAIAAHANREIPNIPNSKEEYYWLVWITLGPDLSARLLLTSDNLITSKSPDSVFAASKASFLSSN